MLKKGSVERKGQQEGAESVLAASNGYGHDVGRDRDHVNVLLKTQQTQEVHSSSCRCMHHRSQADKHLRQLGGYLRCWLACPKSCVMMFHRNEHRRQRVQNDRVRDQGRTQAGW